MKTNSPLGATLSSVQARYVLAAGAALFMLAIRALFDPALNPGASYFLYFPAVIFVAYFAGLTPGLLAVGVAGAGAYLFFSDPAFQLKDDLRANLRLLLFVLSAAAVAYAVSRIRAYIDTLLKEIAETSAVTHAQAELFQEHAERVAGHLQLLSALLEQKSRDDADPEYSRELMNAASRSMLISRLHREFAGSDARKVDFPALAERLAEAALKSRHHPPIVISVEGELSIVPEQATSLALMLLEIIHLRAAQGAPGCVRIVLGSEESDGVLNVIEDEPPGDDSMAPVTRMLTALAEQMGGRLVLGRNPRKKTLRFVFPLTARPLPKWDPLEPLH